MALIDVSFLLSDPDFTDTATLITRAMTVNEWGEGETQESSVQITAVIQPATGKDLERLPEGAKLHETIRVWYRGELLPERENGYADIVVWKGKRYQVKTADPWDNYGAGYWRALCVMEGASA